MNKTGFHPMWMMCVSTMLWTSAPALAAGDVAAADAAALYQRERSVCASGQSHQDRATCLREAGAAYAQMRRDGMVDHDMAFEQNAQKRCQVLPNDERSDCLSRMQGHGSTSGSVSGGGIYRELVTTEAAAPTAARPAAGSSSVVPK